MEQLLTKEIIQDIVARELKGLCITCTHAGTCVYQKAAKKTIIQCELFEPDEEERNIAKPLYGLCTTCDHAPYCNLAGRKSGVWRCNEFK